MRLFQNTMATFVSWCLLLTGVGNGFAFQDNLSNAQPLPQGTQQSSEQLQELVAPIALYPDSLIAQILPAASYPEQIVDAERWMEQHKDLTGKTLATQVDMQSWDASVKAMTQFPAVLANMSQNLAWTSELGDAYVNQQQDLSQAIQTMRERARQVGNLDNTPQEKVSTKGQTIVIEPAQPDIVYVPQYDPWLVYGAPLAVFPGWYPYPGLFIGGPGIEFGLGFGIGLFGGFGWGWHNWGFDWRHGGRVVYNHNTYFSHSSTIVNRNSFRGGGPGFNHAGDFRRSFAGHDGFHLPSGSHAMEGMHSGAFGGFGNGGIARDNAFRGQSSFAGHAGGFGGGGFHGGGFHGGGGHR
jgi:hypothetical protein